MFAIIYTDHKHRQQNVVVADKEGAFEMAQKYYEEYRKQLDLKIHRGKDKMTVSNNESTLKVISFTAFKKLYPRWAEEITRQRNKGIVQDPALDAVVMDGDNEDRNHFVLTDNTATLWYEFEETEHTRYSFYENNDEAEQRFADAATKRNVTPSVEDGVRWITTTEGKMFLGTYKQWKERHPEDDRMYCAKHNTKSFPDPEKYEDMVVIWSEKLIDGDWDLAFCNMTDFKSCKEVVDMMQTQIGRDTGITPIENGFNILPSSYCNFYVAKFPLFYNKWTKEANQLVANTESGTPQYVKHMPKNNPYLTANE